MAKWIICCAWPYVNTIPHLGTFIHLLSADVFTKFLKMKGEEVISVTGSDEHGTPIEVEAIRKGVNPKEITDKYHLIITKLLKEYNIEFSNYTRTENPIHIENVQNIFKKIYDNGYIFTKEMVLPYCEKCNHFLPDRFVEGGCPYCNFESARGDQCDNCGRVLEPSELVNSRCVFCQSSPQSKKTKHWYFDLPRFSDKIKKYLDSNSQLPTNAKNFSYRWLEEGLKSRAVTRDNKWGIPAPFPKANNKTIYVWFEAVLGYISAVIEWGNKTGKKEILKEFWFNQEVKNIHFIGKDNIPFHTIIFPSLLLATHDPYILPYQISSTEFILYESKKFSKSRKIGIWVDETLKIAEPDYWRFVLMMMRPETKDSNFTWNEFLSHVNVELNDTLGNFIYRTLQFIWKQYKGEIPSREYCDKIDEEILKVSSDHTKRITELLDNCKLREALTMIINLARKGNKYFSLKEPWHTIKENPKITSTTLNIAVQLVYLLSLLCYPFMPQKSKAILKQLNLDYNVNAIWQNIENTTLPSGHKISKPKLLFQKIQLKEIEQNLNRYTRLPPSE